MNQTIILFTNQKGGVGKTTTCRELLFYFGQNYRVLGIDTDPQGNLTKGLIENPETGLYDALTGPDYETAAVTDSIDLLAGDKRLTILEDSLIGQIDAFTRLKDLLEQERFKEYDFIFIDSPPNLKIMTSNAMAVSHHFILPMSPGLYTLQGTNDLMEIISKVRKSLNPELSLLGVIINAYDSKPVITRQITQEIMEAFGNKVFKTSLSRTIRLEEAIAEQTGVIHLKNVGKSRVKEEVKAIGLEMLSRLMGVGHEARQ
ncbi:MAG: ParA family protein [Spirochaetes bacterium]|nr:ParA family protein [Spirochaetota bacterium]